MPLNPYAGPDTHYVNYGKFQLTRVCITWIASSWHTPVILRVRKSENNVVNVVKANHHSLAGPQIDQKPTDKAVEPESYREFSGAEVDQGRHRRTEGRWQRRRGTHRRYREPWPHPCRKDFSSNMAPWRPEPAVDEQSATHFSNLEGGGTRRIVSLEFAWMALVQSKAICLHSLGRGNICQLSVCSCATCDHEMEVKPEPLPAKPKQALCLKPRPTDDYLSRQEETEQKDPPHRRPTNIYSTCGVWTRRPRDRRAINVQSG